MNETSKAPSIEHNVVLCINDNPQAVALTADIFKRLPLNLLTDGNDSCSMICLLLSRLVSCRTSISCNFSQVKFLTCSKKHKHHRCYFLKSEMISFYSLSTFYIPDAYSYGKVHFVSSIFVRSALEKWLLFSSSVNLSIQRNNELLASLSSPTELISKEVYICHFPCYK